MKLDVVTHGRVLQVSRLLIDEIVDWLTPYSDENDAQSITLSNSHYIRLSEACLMVLASVEYRKRMHSSLLTRICQIVCM